MRFVLGVALLVAACQVRSVLPVRTIDGDTGQPLAGVLVQSGDNGLMTYTDSAGKGAVLLSRRRGRLKLTRVGYHEIEAGTRFGSETLVVTLYRQQPRTVKGRVVEAFSGMGLANVPVRVEEIDRTVLSGPDGEFVLADLQPGSLRLSVMAAGYAARPCTVRPVGGETISVLISLTDTTNVGTVRGQVVDRITDRPIAGVRVEVWGTANSALTDSTGEFLLDNVPAGVHLLVATADGWVSQQIRFRVMKHWVAEVSFRLERTLR